MSDLLSSANAATQAIRRSVRFLGNSGIAGGPAAGLRTVLKNAPTIKDVAKALIASCDTNMQRNFDQRALETMMGSLGEAEKLAKDLLDRWDAIELEKEAYQLANRDAIDGLIESIEKAHGQVLSLEYLLGQPCLCITSEEVGRADLDVERIHHTSSMLEQSMQQCNRVWRAILDLDCMKEIMAILHSPLAGFGCDEKVAEGLQDGTREWAFEKVDRWLEEDQSIKPVLWIRASAGMGKSVLAAALSRRYEARGQLVGALFVQFYDAKRSDPRELVQSLAVHHVLQAAKRLKLHHDKTLEHLLLARLKELGSEGERDKVVRMWVALVSDYWQQAVWLKQKVEQERLDKLLEEKAVLQKQQQRKAQEKEWQQLLDAIDAQVHEIEQQLEALARPQLVIIDGLDEGIMRPAAAGDPLKQLLRALCEGCPFKIIVTSRPDDSRVGAVLESKLVFGKVEKLTIEADDELHQRDIRRVVRHILFEEAEELHEGSPEHRIVSHVVKRSQGMFVYLRLVEGGLRGQGKQLADRVGQQGEEEVVDRLLRDLVPASLDDAYSKYVERLMAHLPDPETRKLAKTVLRVLIAAGEAVSLSLLDDIVGRPVQSVVSDLGRLYFTVEGRVVVPYHKSFIDWVESLRSDLNAYAGSSIRDVLIDLDEGRRLLLARIEPEVREVGEDPLWASRMDGETAARECRNMAIAFFLRSKRYDLAAVCVSLPWLVWRLCQPSGDGTLTRELRSVRDACQGLKTAGEAIVELGEASRLVLSLLPHLQAACGEGDSRERRASNISSHICSRLNQQAGNGLIEKLKKAAVQWVEKRGGWRTLAPDWEQAERENSAAAILPVKHVDVRDVLEVYSDLRGQAVTFVCLYDYYTSRYSIKVWDVEWGVVIRNLEARCAVSRMCFVDSGTIAWASRYYPVDLSLWRWEDAGGGGQDNGANSPEKVATLNMESYNIAAMVAVAGSLVVADVHSNGFWLCSLETKACMWLACDVGKMRVIVEERQWQQTGPREDLLFICHGEGKWWLCRLAVRAGHGEEEGEAKWRGDVKLSRLAELPGKYVQWAGRLSEDRLAVWMDGRVSVWRLRGYGSGHGMDVKEVEVEKVQQFDCPLSVCHYSADSEDDYETANTQEWRRQKAIEGFLGYKVGQK